MNVITNPGSDFPRGRKGGLQQMIMSLVCT